MMNAKNDGNKYVCPNDRQLCLRAKLNTGWCAARSGPPLTASERSVITEVVRRAEKLDEMEARRVGRLVARLEGLRRVTRGPVWKCCALCGDRGRIFSPLRNCSYCSNAACSRCITQLNHSTRALYLCLLCSETRDMWMKSGAWFYKGIPKFVLPEKRNAIQRYIDNRLTTSLQEIPCSSSAEGLARSDSSDLGSRPCLYNAPPDFTRQTSCIDGFNTYNSLQNDMTDSICDYESLHHGISAISLNRTESFGQKSSNGLKRTNSKGSAYSIRSFKKEISRPKSPEKTLLPASIPDTGLGTIEIKLNYSTASKSLACSIVRARGLPGMDMTGMADPFCRVELLPRDANLSCNMRTKTVLKTRNPEFNETLNFYGLSEVDVNEKKLDIKIMDDDKYGCDVMGRVTVSLRDSVKVNGTNTIRLALNPDSESKDEQPKPKILLSLSYNTKKRALIVLISKCTNLPAMDTNGYSDPFIKLHLDPDPYHKKYKTSIKWRNLNPIYNEEFSFETRPTELSRQSLKLTVWDKDYGKPDDFLGSLVLGSTSKGKRLKHWLDCIRFPDHRHEQWHALTDTYNV